MVNLTNTTAISDISMLSHVMFLCKIELAGKKKKCSEAYKITVGTAIHLLIKYQRWLCLFIGCGAGAL